MLVITHQILTENLRLERTPSAITNDSIERVSLVLSVNENDFLNGGSFFDSLESIEYCKDFLRWHHLLLLPFDGIVSKFFNPGTKKLMPFDPLSTFTPYSAIIP
jgi:hypothetical protein